MVTLTRRWCAQVQHVLTSSNIDSKVNGLQAESKLAEPERLPDMPDGQLLAEVSRSAPLVDPALWQPDPLLVKPEGASPPHSEPGRQTFPDRDGAESWATMRTARDSFETASTSQAHLQERCMSECSERDDQQPVLTGKEIVMSMIDPYVVFTDAVPTHSKYSVITVLWQVFHCYW